MGLWRGLEASIEITVPLMATGLMWGVALTTLGSPNPVREVTPLEIHVFMGACVAVTSWMMSRNLFLARKRSPWTLLATNLIICFGLLFAVGARSRSNFETACSNLENATYVDLSVIDTNDPLEMRRGVSGPACKIGGIQDNPYLVGTLLRPTWSGSFNPLSFLWYGLVVVLSTLAYRDFRLRRTRIAGKVFRLLQFAPSGGANSSMGKPAPKAGKVIACNNHTLWGETCGQIYAAEKEWYPGEWCSRCQQPFTAAPRRFTFKIVSLFTADVDVLNGIERIDTVSWPRGERIAPDGRLSGQERWVTMGQMDFPDVITVSQMLSLVHENLSTWVGSEDPRISHAAKIAAKRASRIAAWLWWGQLSHRLTYARPNTKVSLAIGSQRLRDLIEDTSEELWLQLDIGLLPMEVRTGFKKTFIDEGRAPELQNSKFDLWIPVGNPNAADGGVWVPRVEGEALRLWLSTDRLRDENMKGVTVPLPYRRYDPENRGDPGSAKPPSAGTLDMVRYDLGANGMEPITDRDVGASIFEWDWLEWEQIELLRKQALVLAQLRS